jgi:hypothetical protein
LQKAVTSLMESQVASGLQHVASSTDFTHADALQWVLAAASTSLLPALQKAVTSLMESQVASGLQHVASSRALVQPDVLAQRVLFAAVTRPLPASQKDATCPTDWHVAAHRRSAVEVPLRVVT